VKLYKITVPENAHKYIRFSLYIYIYIYIYHKLLHVSANYVAVFSDVKC